MTPVAAAPNEFPTLDLDELDHTPLRSAVLVAAPERPELPGILAAALPAVVHARHRDESMLIDEHEFIDTDTGEGVRYVVSLDGCNQTQVQISESGPAGLWDRLVLTCADWEHSDRPDPTHWLLPAQQVEHGRRGIVTASPDSGEHEGSGL